MTGPTAQMRGYESILSSRNIRASAHRRSKPAWIAISYLALPNLTLVASMILLGISPHGYIDVDDLLIGALGMWLPRRACFVLLMTEAVADFAYTVCYTYHFSPANLILSLHYLFVLPSARVFEGGLLLVLSLLINGTLSMLRPERRARLRVAVLLAVIAALLFSADLLGGRSPFWHRIDLALFSARITRSPLLTIGLRELRAPDIDNKEEEDRPMQSASATVISSLNNRGDAAAAPNVVLIVVESWGLAMDGHLDQALTSAYEDQGIAINYKIERGTVPFSGLTVPGEARELCSSTIGFGILREANELRSKCLPAFFHTRGYRDLAVHGYQGQMFFRSVWYPQLGFDESWFQPDLAGAGLPSCRGALPGICDRSIAGWIGSALAKPHDRPLFIYWVTLNSHLPEPVHPDLPDDGVCAADRLLSTSAALCTWFRLVRAVHQSVARVAMVPTERPTIFVLVGDHAPPFGSPRVRDGFSSTDVPYIVLTPIAPGGR